MKEKIDRYYYDRVTREKEHKWLIFDRQSDEKVAVVYAPDMAVKIVDLLNGKHA